jgi:hypothetical protein
VCCAGHPFKTPLERFLTALWSRAKREGVTAAATYYFEEGGGGERGFSLALRFLVAIRASFSAIVAVKPPVQVVAAAKAKATREARGTKGKRQKRRLRERLHPRPRLRPLAQRPRYRRPRRHLANGAGTIRAGGASE